MVDYSISTRGIVTSEPKDGRPSWSLQDLKVREPKEDELLVRVVASGVCHTDLVISMAPPEMGNYPKVLGHEGSGIVEKVGSKISHAKDGDFVLLSFDYCGKDSCYNCSSETPGYCPEFMMLNIACHPAIFQGQDGSATAGHFFGQSSFANYAIVKGTSALNVTGSVNEEELKLFAPFGCGFQTGAGAVTELANATGKDQIAVFGLGGVGMVALMAAKIRGCRTIIAVDRVQSRLEVAKSVGATHTIDTSGFQNLEEDLARAIKDISPLGTNISIDTTGVLDIVKAGVQALSPRGQMILIGIMYGLTLPVDLSDLLASGKSIRGCIEGNVKPQKFIPQMIQWYREGKLPIEKLIKHYPVDNFEQALGDMHTGATIKPILLW
ncbi:hypothetical protein BDV96DRAFT_175332 [Lophiotrema nucula]|uniref:Chaperonin 10-like protein n=1 Tax=Lophiotrema nucula TaxID=690887 RepID=A0A6A5YXQ4_9PLEO|nr:hypothetical protein BDV96DRAFT_175332 [Lophiotrema nucula]